MRQDPAIHVRYARRFFYTLTILIRGWSRLAIRFQPGVVDESVFEDYAWTEASLSGALFLLLGNVLVVGRGFAIKARAHSRP